MKEAHTAPTGTQKLLPVFKDAFQAFKEDDVPRMAAALAYHTIFAIGPLLLLAVGIAGLFLSQTDIENSIQQQVGARFGSDAIPGLQDFLNGTQNSGVGATVFGSLLLLWTASSLFVQIQTTLNKIWEVTPQKTSFVKMMVGRLIVALMTLVLGAVIVAFLGLNVYLTVQTEDLFNGSVVLNVLLKLFTVLLSIGLFTGLFMLLYRYLPNIKLDWQDVKFGAFSTAVLFVLGQYLISLYLANFSPAGSFGAAGTLVVFILWVYLSGQIFFFGAEVTWAYSHRYGTIAQKEKVLEPAVQPKTPVARPTPEKPALQLLMQVISGGMGLLGGILITVLTFPIALVVGLFKMVKGQIRKLTT